LRAQRSNPNRVSLRVAPQAPRSNLLNPPQEI
jgi:hypothetical protein